MTMFIRYLLAAVFAVFATAASAQGDLTTGNLIYSTANPPPQGVNFQWSGFIQTESSGGGLSGGHIPGYNTSTGTFMFGYTQSTIGYALAVNSALSGTGIGIGGVQYGFRYFNQDFSRGFLSTSVSLLSSTGQTLHSYSHQLPQTTEGWTQFDQTQTFGNWYSLANLSTVSMTWTGRDDRGWAGYYGPMFTDQYLRFTYTTDMCSVNPLSSPDCPGYAAAFFTQQCTANPLSDPACPGYAAAFFTQQCTISALWNPACPGYAAALLTQQCSANPLYSDACPGYQAATEQCSTNPLSGSYCPGYQTASAQCSANVLTRSYCPGYTTAMAACGPDPQSNTMCPGYRTQSASQATGTDLQVQIAADGKVTTEMATVADPTVNAVITERATSTAPSATATVNLAPQPTATTAATTAQPDSKPAATAGASEQKSDQPRTARQELQERRQAAARAQAIEQGKNLANAMGEAATMEAQVTAQASVMQAMAFTPGFDAYGRVTLPDAQGYRPFEIYQGQRNVDNPAGRRFLTGSDSLHAEMVDQQWGGLGR